jgi:hypothetical protein
MDQYECCTLEDAKFIATLLKSEESIIFSYSPDQINAYVIFICPNFTTVGKIPFGGIPNGFYIGVSLIGAFHFNLEQELSSGYLAEKLKLGKVDAENLAEILNAIGKECYGR